MRRKAFRLGILWRFIVIPILMLGLVLTKADSVAAQSLSDYFVYTYTVEFSKTEITGNEIFTATVQAEATCKKDLPVSVSEASLTGRIVAVHQTSGARVILNSEYNVNINPFPGRSGETIQASRVVSLQFPQGSQSGTYSIAAELVEAKVKVGDILWIPVTALLPSSQTAGSVTYTSGGGGGAPLLGGGGGAVPSPSPPPGTNDVSDFVGADGTFTKTVEATSFDSKCKLIINKDTKGLSRTGGRFTKITMTKKEGGPAAPQNSKIIGVTYDLGPDGATFDRPITLTITYDESLIPQGIAEESLVIAMWDEATRGWVILTGCTVNPGTNTITVSLSRFAAFTVLAYERAATFVVSELTITPGEVAIGKEVTVSSLVTNTGDLTGSYKVTLKIDNVVVTTKEVTLKGGGREEVKFAVVKDIPGTYTVAVDGLSGTFVVRSLSLINWYIIGGIIAACLALIAVIYLTVIPGRRKAFIQYLKRAYIKYLRRH